MKHIKFIGIMILCLIIMVFAACNGGDPSETTDSPASSEITEASGTESEYTPAPESTSVPDETTAPDTTTAPEETTTPPETEEITSAEETTDPPAPEQNPGEGLEYKAFGNYAVLVGIGSCTDKDIVISDTYNGLPVTEIWHEAFSGVKGMTSVKIPEGVTYIESSAFKNCPDLREVYLPSTLENIAGSIDFGFIGCSSIEIIEMAEGNQKYYSVGNCLIDRKNGTLVFGGSKSIIPTDGSVKSIGAHAFAGNLLLKSVTIPEGVTDIHPSAFAGCANLESVSLPKTLKTIRQSAFEGCSSLKSILIPDSVTEIYNAAFKKCTGLKDVTLSKNLTMLDSEVFDSCAIESIAIPEGVKELGAVFSGCEKLKSVTLPEGFERFVGHTFAGCTSLESINLPKSLKYVGFFTFKNCSSLKEFRYDGTSAEWISVSKQEKWNEDAAFTSVKCSDGEVKLFADSGDEGSAGLEYKMMTNYAVLVGIGTCEDKKVVIASTFNGVPVTVIDSLAFYNCAFIEEVVIPEGVTMIRDEAFYLCTNLKKVTLPTTLDIIDDWVFANCESLENIAIPDRVMWVGQRAFSDCKSLTSVTFGKNLEQIQENSFMNCTSLKSVTIPGKVHYFGNSAFLDCTSLESVTLTKGMNMIGSSVFSGCAKLSSIRYTGSIADWKEVDKYSNWYKDAPIEYVTCSDGNVGFTDTYDGTQGVVYKISKDGKSAYLASMGTFSGSELILATEFNGVPVTDIPNRIINNSPNLKSIYISKNITTLPAQLFYNCDNVVSLTVDPENAVYRSEGNCIIEKKTNTLLFGCNGSVIPEGVKVIREKAFYACASLESLTIPEGVEVIGNNAFSSCTALKSVKLPESLVSVGDHAFYGCSSLEELKFGAKTETIGNYAFSECTGLKSIDLPDTATLGEMAFYNCSSLKSIKIPASQTSLSGTFWGCSSLESVVMHDKLEALIGGVFMGCTSLGSITLPASVTRISGNTFADCVSLTEFVYEGTVEAWTSINMLTNWKDGAPFTVVKCSDGEARAQILTDTDAIIAAEDYWRVSDSDLLMGGYYIRVKEIPSLESNCFKIVLAKPDSEGNYPIVSELLVDKRTGEISEPVYTYSDIPEAIRKVLFNESTYIFVNHEGSNEINFKDTVLWGGYRAACDSLSYGVADLDGDGKIEVILGTQSSNILLREYDGKVYGYEFANNEISVLFTDGTYSWKKNAGIIQCTSRLTFDGAEVKSVEILRFDRSKGNAWKYYVEGVEVTKAEYDAREASFSDEVITYKPFSLYPIEIYPPN